MCAAGVSDVLALLQEKALKAGHEASFAVQLNGARGLVDAKIHSPSGATEDCPVSQLDSGEAPPAGLMTVRVPHQLTNLHLPLLLLLLFLLLFPLLPSHLLFLLLVTPFFIFFSPHPIPPLPSSLFLIRLSSFVPCSTAPHLPHPLPTPPILPLLLSILHPPPPSSSFHSCIFHLFYLGFKYVNYRYYTEYLSVNMLLFCVAYFIIILNLPALFFQLFCCFDYVIFSTVRSPSSSSPPSSSVSLLSPFPSSLLPSFSLHFLLLLPRPARHQVPPPGEWRPHAGRAFQRQPHPWQSL